MEPLLVDTGERLPCLRDRETWLPARLALDWALETRYRVASTTLAADLRGIGLTYEWAARHPDIQDLDQYLTSGKTLSSEHLRSLLHHLRRRYPPARQRALPSAENQTPIPIHPVNAGTYNQRLFAVESFLTWTLDPYHHGGSRGLSERDVELEAAHLARVFGAEYLATASSYRQEPLTSEEIRLIRRAIGPDELGRFPAVFAATTRFRNWVMFETSLGTGCRKGELLTLRLRSMDPDEIRAIRIERNHDAREDPRRARTPAVKTRERKVPPASDVLLPALLRYITAAPPVGRNTPDFSTSPYLFVTHAGAPVSVALADDIICKIGLYASRLVDTEPAFDVHTREQFRQSLIGLTWHRLRHTWAEQAALYLLRRYGENGWSTLKYWGGWASEESMEHYIQHARSRLNETVAREMEALFTFGEPVA